MPRRHKKEKTQSPPDPRRTARLQDFYTLDKIQRQLKRLSTSPVISDEQLAELSIARGSFDIDHDDPIDFEPRYFLPGPEKTAKRALRKTPLDWPEFIGRFMPINYSPSSDALWNTIYAIDDAASIARRFFYTAITTTKWNHDSYFPGRYLPDQNLTWELPDGHTFFHRFESANFYNRMVIVGNDEDLLDPDPNLPHTVASVCDSVRPEGGSLLRSELLMAVALVKTQVRKLDSYLDHDVFPALVLSFHGRFTARVLQAHVYNGQLVIRTSRLIKLHTPHMTPDMMLLLRWHNSIPMGETRRLPSEPEVTREEGGTALILNQEHHELDPRPTITPA